MDPGSRDAVTSDAQARDRALRVPQEWPLLLAAAGVVLAFHGLIDFDPYQAVPTDLRGIEGALFDPVPSAPGFVFIVFLWKIVEQHHEIRRALRGPGSAWGALPLGLSAIVYGWSCYTGADELLLPSLSLFLLGGGLAAGGRRGAGALVAPAVILLFALPIPASLLNRGMWDLQLWTAGLAATVANLWSDAFRSGDLIFHDRQIFQVIESCAGLATMSTLTLTSFIIPARQRRSRLHAFLLVASAPLVSFGINTLRVLTIMANPLSHIGSVHTTQGILMLVVGILTLVGLDRVLGRLLPSPAPQRPAPAAGRPTALVALTGLACALALTSVLLPRYQPDPIRYQRFLKLRTLPGHRGVAQPADDDFLGTVAFTQSAITRYEVDGEPVDVFIGVNNRTIRHNSALSPKTRLPGAGWVAIRRQPIRQPETGREMTELVVRPPPQLPAEDRSRELVHHYVLGGAPIATETVRALLALDASPFRRTDRQVVVRLSTPLGESETSREDARRRLFEVEGWLEPNLERERTWH